jgi:hypothetical protein
MCPDMNLVSVKKTGQIKQELNRFSRSQAGFSFSASIEIGFSVRLLELTSLKIYIKRNRPRQSKISYWQFVAKYKKIHKKLKRDITMLGRVPPFGSHQPPFC